MLNIDDRLIKETLPAIKPNGLAVLLVISIHLNKESGTCFPSHERIMKMTGLGSESVYNALKALKKEGLLLSSQSIDSKQKTFSRRTFKINTDYIGVWIAAKNAPELETEPLTDLPDAATPHAVEPHAANHETYLLNELEQLNKLEQLNNEGVPPPPAENSNNLEEEKNKRGLVPPPPAEAAAHGLPEGTAEWTKETEDWLKRHADPTHIVRTTGPGSPGIVEAEGIRLPAATALTYDQYPRPRNSQELKESMRNYFVANPREWQDGVLEQSHATKWPAEKIGDCMTAFCAHQEAENNLKRTYGQYKGMLVKWFLAQPSFDRVKPGASAQKPYSTPQDQPSPGTYMKTYS